MEHVAANDTTNKAAQISVNITGIGNLEPHVLIIIDGGMNALTGERYVTATDIELFEVSVWADECREGPPYPYVANISFFDGEEQRSAEVHLITGEMTVKGKKDHRSYYFDPAGITSLRSAVRKMLVAAAAASDLWPEATIDSVGDSSLVDGDGNRLAADLTRVQS